MNCTEASARRDVLKEPLFVAKSAVHHFRSERVLFAAQAEAFSSQSLKYAQTIAGMSDASLLVLLVTAEERGQPHSGRPDRESGEVPSNDCDRPILPPALLPVEYLRRRGAFASTVLRTCAEFPPGLVVLPPDGGHTGRCISGIADTAQVPVLAPRHVGGRADHRTIVVGVDLRSPALPVLHAAAEFAGRFGARLVVVHNLSPVTVRAKGARSQGCLISRGPDDFMRAFELLLARVWEVNDTAESIVTTDVDAARAILDIARQRHADLVVVGVRRRPSWRLPIGGRVPERVAKFVLAFALHSPFLFLISFVGLVLEYWMVMAEEEDLVLRFGSAYEDYRRVTGAFWPRLTKEAKETIAPVKVWMKGKLNVERQKLH